MEWDGHLSFGQVPPLELVNALPVLVERFQALRFDQDGRALIDGEAHEGLRLVAGVHGEIGAAYVLVRRARAGAHNTTEVVSFVSVEAYTADVLSVLVAVVQRKGVHVHRRVDIFTPAAPTRVELTMAQDLKPHEDGGDMSWNLRLDATRLDSEIGPAPAILDFVHEAKGMHLEMWPDGRTSARFEASVSNLSTFWQTVGRWMTGFYTMVIHSFVRSHLASLHERYESREEGVSATDIGWAVFVDALVRNPSKASRTIISDVAAT